MNRFEDEARDDSLRPVKLAGGDEPADRGRDHDRECSQGSIQNRRTPFGSGKGGRPTLAGQTVVFLGFARDFRFTPPHTVPFSSTLAHHGIERPG